MCVVFFNQNFLIEADGLNELWEQGVKSDWDGPLGDHDAADVPMIFKRVGGAASTDLSGMGNGGDETADGEAFGTGQSRACATSARAFTVVGACGDATERTKVREMSYEGFRQKLITHFSIKWARQEIVWPSRNGVMSMATP
jgi:hypothetical protein